jgi:hypothetical protein
MRGQIVRLNPSFKNISNQIFVIIGHIQHPPRRSTLRAKQPVTTT